MLPFDREAGILSQPHIVCKQSLVQKLQAEGKLGREEAILTDLMRLVSLSSHFSVSPC